MIGFLGGRHRGRAASSSRDGAAHFTILGGRAYADKSGLPARDAGRLSRDSPRVPFRLCGRLHHQLAGPRGLPALGRRAGRGLSPTDAVAVSIAKRSGVLRIITVLEGEGLFNDATSARPPVRRDEYRPGPQTNTPTSPGLLIGRSPSPLSSLSLRVLAGSSASRRAPSRPHQEATRRTRFSPSRALHRIGPPSTWEAPAIVQPVVTPVNRVAAPPRSPR